MAKEIKYEIPDGTTPSHCRFCERQIFWVNTVNGKNMPVDPDGTPHFATCPETGRFRTGKKPNENIGPTRCSTGSGFNHNMDQVENEMFDNECHDEW